MPDIKIIQRARPGVATLKPGGPRVRTPQRSKAIDPTPARRPTPAALPMKSIRRAR